MHHYSTILKTRAGSRVMVRADDELIVLDAGGRMTAEETLELVEMLLAARRTVVAIEEANVLSLPALHLRGCAYRGRRVRRDARRFVARVRGLHRGGG